MKIVGKKYKEELLIQNQSIELLKIESSLFSKGLTLEHVKIGRLEIANGCKIQGTVLVRNCQFEHNAEIRGLHAKGSIRFIECQFQKSFRIKYSKVRNDVEFNEVIMREDLEIDSTDIGKVDINLLTTTNLRITDDKQSKIESIKLNRSKVYHQFEILKLHQLNELRAVHSNVDFLFSVKGLAQEASITIDVKDCYFKYLKIDHIISKQSLQLEVNDSITEKIQLSTIVGKSGNIDLSRTTTSGYSSIEGIGENMYLDVSSLLSENLKIDENLVAPIHQGRQPKQLFIEKKGIDQKIDTLRFINKIYSLNEDIEKQDKVTSLLREWEMKKHIEIANSRWGAIIKKGKLFIGKYMLGWGVSLPRLFYAFAFTTLFFGIIHWILMYVNDDLFFIFKQARYTGTVAPFELSLFYMIGFYSDIIEVQGVNYTIGLLQHIIGIAYITLIIGVAIRKLVN